MRLDASLEKLEDDWRRAGEPLRSALELIASVAAVHEVRPEAVAKLLEAGVPPSGVVDVLHVVFLFSSTNRVGEALGFDSTHAAKQAALLKLFEYIFLPAQLVPVRWRYPRKPRRQAARRPAGTASLGPSSSA